MQLVPRKLSDAEKDTAKAIGRRIREAYTRAGMTRAVFAERLGAYYHDVDRLEKGQQPSPERLTRIAELCGVTERWLVRGTMYAETFHQWLEHDAPDDLHDIERELLGAINFPAELHPGRGWYTSALAAWRLGTRNAVLDQTHVRRMLTPVPRS